MAKNPLLVKFSPISYTSINIPIAAQTSSPLLIKRILFTREFYPKQDPYDYMEGVLKGDFDDILNSIIYTVLRGLINKPQTKYNVFTAMQVDPGTGPLVLPTGVARDIGLYESYRAVNFDSSELIKLEPNITQEEALAWKQLIDFRTAQLLGSAPFIIVT